MLQILYHTYPSGALGSISSIYEIVTKCPVLNAYLSLCHLPGFILWQGTLLFTKLFPHCRFWDKEVLRAENDAQKPSLTRAIIKCYWKSYLALGIFTLIEVKAFTYRELFFRTHRVNVLAIDGAVMDGGTEGRSGQMGFEGILRSKD